MPTWDKVLVEIGMTPGPIDLVRRQYVKAMAEYTNRNVIIYYSGWLQRADATLPAVVYDGDVNSFMTAIHGLDRSKGLDLILHTPGGNVTATEAIVKYLRKMFNGDIRCFVPQLAMSAGTMMACACKEIWMGKQSSIGPIDPQFGNIAAFGVIDEFNQAAQEIKTDPSRIPLWQSIFAKVPAGFITECSQAIDLSSQLVQDWLETGMFASEKNAVRKARAIVNALNNHKDTKAHGRHIDAEQAAKIGLKVKMLEDDQKLQDAVLTVHHACLHTFSMCQTLQKIVENHKGIGTFLK